MISLTRLALGTCVPGSLDDAWAPELAGADLGAEAGQVAPIADHVAHAGHSIGHVEGEDQAGLGDVGVDVHVPEAGNGADLIVLDANPLDDLRSLSTVRLVMKGGVLYRTADIAKAIGFLLASQR